MGAPPPFFFLQYCVSGELHLLDAAKLTVQLMKPISLPAGADAGAANGAAPLLLTAGKPRCARVCVCWGAGGVQGVGQGLVWGPCQFWSYGCWLSVCCGVEEAGRRFFEGMLARHCF